MSLWRQLWGYGACPAARVDWCAILYHLACVRLGISTLQHSAVSSLPRALPLFIQPLDPFLYVTHRPTLRTFSDAHRTWKATISHHPFNGRSTDASAADDFLLTQHGVGGRHGLGGQCHGNRISPGII
jgi:hypothetical protein